MSDLLRRTSLYAHTLRYLKPWQVAGRLVHRAKKVAGLARLPEPPPALHGRLERQVAFPEHDPWNQREDLLKGRFCFLSRSEELGMPVDWRAGHMPLLWQFNLHYFQYLHLLEKAEQEALCRSWVQANPVGSGAAWHPYPISLRIVNWCRADLQPKDLQESLYRQAAYLYRNLETYVYGNHLLENARALVYAGRFFDGQGEAAEWLEKGLALYRRETPIQVLSDGGHYERSPMYQALMLEGYLDVINLLPPGHPDRTWLVPTVQGMSDFLAALTHPDGRIALFNDATQEIAPAPDVLQQYVRALTGYTPAPRSAFPETGYFIHREKDVHLMIDGGPVGPPHLMAHAHADVFSFELSLGGKRFVVDAGVFAYEAGAMRTYVRSTAAHNTVCVDGVDQVECWGSFRVARRAAPQDVSFAQQAGRSEFEGTFSGYEKLIGDGITHRRRISIDGVQREIRVEDIISGRGRHHVVSRLHLHPDVAVTEAGNGAILQREDITSRLYVQDAPLGWEEGWYCPAFGVRRRTRTAIIGGTMDLPVSFSFTLRY